MAKRDLFPNAFRQRRCDGIGGAASRQAAGSFRRHILLGIVKQDRIPTKYRQSLKAGVGGTMRGISNYDCSLGYLDAC